MTSDQLLYELKKSFRLLAKNTLTLEEAADYIGLSESTVLKMARERKLSSFRSGKSPYFDKAELERWMRQNPVKSNEEIESTAATFNIKKAS